MASSFALLIIIVIVLAIITILRINAIYLYFSLAVGYVLTNTISSDTNSLMSLFSSSSSPTILNNIKLIILFVPVVATALFMFRSIKKKKIIINLLPSIAFIILGLFLVIPLMTSSSSSFITSSSYWSNIVKAKDLLIEMSALITLTIMYIERLGRHSLRESKRKYYRS